MVQTFKTTTIQRHSKQQYKDTHKDTQNYNIETFSFTKTLKITTQIHSNLLYKHTINNTTETLKQ